MVSRKEGSSPATLDRDNCELVVALLENGFFSCGDVLKIIVKSSLLCAQNLCQVITTKLQQPRTAFADLFLLLRQAEETCSKLSEETRNYFFGSTWDFGSRCSLENQEHLMKARGDARKLKCNMLCNSIRDWRHAIHHCRTHGSEKDIYMSADGLYINLPSSHLFKPATRSQPTPIAVQAKDERRRNRRRRESAVEMLLHSLKPPSSQGALVHMWFTEPAFMDNVIVNTPKILINLLHADRMRGILKPLNRATPYQKYVNYCVIPDESYDEDVGDRLLNDVVLDDGLTKVSEGDPAQGESVATDRLDTAIGKCRSILDKLTPESFESLVPQLFDCAIMLAQEGEAALHEMIKLIYSKATTQHIFAKIAARACRVLHKNTVSAASEALDNQALQTANSSFRRMLLTQCRTEFEKASPDPTDFDNPTDFEAEILKHRKRRRGQIRFVGELYEIELLTDRMMNHLLRIRDRRIRDRISGERKSNYLVELCGSRIGAHCLFRKGAAEQRWLLPEHDWSPITPWLGEACDIIAHIISKNNQRGAHLPQQAHQALIDFASELLVIGNSSSQFRAVQALAILFGGTSWRLQSDCSLELRTIDTGVFDGRACTSAGPSSICWKDMPYSEGDCSVGGHIIRPLMHTLQDGCPTQQICALVVLQSLTRTRTMPSKQTAQLLSECRQCIAQLVHDSHCIVGMLASTLRDAWEKSEEESGDKGSGDEGEEQPSQRETNGAQKTANKGKRKASKDTARSWGLNDAVQVDGRTGTISLDLRPEHNYVKVRWADTQIESEVVCAEKVGCVL